MRVWLLCDDRPGNVSQCIGIAAALGEPYERKELRYGFWKFLPNFLLGASRRILDRRASSTLEPPWPDLVIAAGRRSGSVARWIKRQSGGETFLAQCMWPGRPVGDYDLIALPEHDGRPAGGCIVTTLGTPNAVTPERIAKECAALGASFSALPSPRIALLVGGASKGGSFAAEHAAELGRLASRMAAEKNGSLLVTTSRRTPPQAVEALKEAIGVPYALHAYGAAGANPYPGMLGLAEAAIVTGDSMSMVSEAASSGLPVYLYAPASLAAAKHRAMHRRLYAARHAFPLTGSWAQTPHLPLRDTQRIAAEIKKRMQPC